MLFTKKGNHDEENATTNSSPNYRSLLLNNCPGISCTQLEIPRPPSSTSSFDRFLSIYNKMVARTSGLFVVFLVTVTFIFVSSFQFGSIGNLHHHSRRHFVALCVVKDGNELNELTVVELKARLKAKGLIVSGLKKDLIERLASSSNEETSSNVSSVDNAKEQKVPVAVPKKVSKNNVPVSKVSTKAEPKQQPKHEPDNEDDFLSQLMAEGDEILQEDRHQSSASGSVRSNSVKSSTSSSSSSSSSSRRSSGSVSSSGSVNVEEIQRLCDQRNELRYHRDYDGADAVRDQLENDFGLKIFDFKNEWVSPRPPIISLQY